MNAVPSITVAELGGELEPVMALPVLRGGGVSDLVEVEHLRARIAYTRLRGWRRWTTRRPAGWSR